jgi:hypothetical protein
VLVLCGIAAAAAYVGVAVWAYRLPGRLPRVLYDGLAPPARYNWVRPPAPLAAGNYAAASGLTTLEFNGMVSPAVLAYTADGQALVSFAPNAVAARPGEATVNIWITPLDPATLAAPPAGLRFDGNAYEIRAVYASSGAPAVLKRPVSVILRYATGATQILHLTGSTWRPVASVDFPAALQRTLEVNSLGVFVAAAPADLPYVHRVSLWIYAGIGAGALGLGALIMWTIRAGRSGRRGDSAGRRRKRWRR